MCAELGSLISLQNQRSVSQTFNVPVSNAEDFSDNEEMFAKVITKWSSNDLMDKIDTIDADEAQGSRPSVFYYRMLFQIEQGTSSCTLVKETLEHRNHMKV